MSPLSHPSAKVPAAPKHDLEKNEAEVVVDEKDSTSSPIAETVLPVPGRILRWNAKVESLSGLEARGIVRVEEDERHGISFLGYLQIAIMWYSANITANNLAVGLLGPLVFGLSFLDSAMTATFGIILGSAVTAYMSTWGAQSGNRTMIVARYFMGYWPSKLTCVLNMILMVGYALISCIISGQILSAVSGGSMTIIVGIVITALISWLVALFGMSLFHFYERWQWIPQTIVLFILIGTASPHFDTKTPSAGDSAMITAGRLSFFSLQLSVPLSWAGAASDFFVYYPPQTSKRLTYLMTLIGLTVSFVFVNLIGIGLGSGVAINESWATAEGVSSGALILEGYHSVGKFGKFCAVVIALGVISNIVPSAYAAALGCQVLGRFGKAVPRWVWVCFVVAIYFVCAVAGRNHLFQIFTNFLALMGYWLISFFGIVLEEHVLFKKALFGGTPLGYDWSAWENQKKLPVGIAALVSFLIGWTGAIIGMFQAWYVGPVAQRVGGGGADIGTWLAFGFTLVAYPGLRYLELKKFGR